jgi:outer membrane protein
MNKLTKFLAPIALLTSVGAHADFIGGSVEAAYWYAGLGGDATAGSSTVDVEDDLDFGSSGNFEVAVTIEHPVPVIPNARLKYTSIDQTEDGELPAGGFDNVATSSVGKTNVETNLDLSHVDLILYYEILDNWVSVDVGLDIKVFDGQLEVSDGTDKSTTDIDKILPLAYASAEFEFPLTDLSFGAELSALSYSDNSIYDGKIRFRQGFSLAFVELGYRQMGVKIEDLSDTDIDLDFGGVYLSTGLDF